MLAGGTGALVRAQEARAETAPIRIGLLAPLTGVVAAGGREIVDGFTMFWDSVGNQAGGRKVEIIVEHGVLVIAGERLAPALKQAAIIHRLEIPQGRFERRIALPAGRFELDRRDIADGCLTLTLRKLG